MFLLLLLLHRPTLIIPPPQKKIKNWQNCCFVSLNTFVKSVQNRSLSSEICQENFCEIGFILIIVFRGNLSQIFPQDRLLFPRICLWKSNEIWLFSATYQRPCIMNGLHYESSWSGCLFLSPPPHFFASWMSVMSNLDQSYLKKWMSELH